MQRFDDNSCKGTSQKDQKKPKKVKNLLKLGSGKGMTKLI